MAVASRRRESPPAFDRRWFDREFTRYLHRVNPSQDVATGLAKLVADRPHALIGGHARNAHLPDQPRATVDVDFVLPRWHALRFVAEALRAYPSLTRRRKHGGAGPVINLIGKDGKVADVIIAEESALPGAALATARRMPVPGLAPLNVPPVEVLIALKLNAASSPDRKKPKAALDRADAVALMELPHDAASVRAALSLAPARARRYYLALRKEVWGGSAPGER